MSDRRKKHGMTGTPTYQSWYDMKRRCDLPSFRQYADYGGRGITYCREWKSFEAFLRDMGPCPEGMTLERIDNDGAYEPRNCRWASRRDQLRNTRQNRFVTYRGETKCVADWAEQFGFGRMTLLNRLDRGWTIEEAFETPVARDKIRISLDGETKTALEWAGKTGISYGAIKSRFYRGWSPREILTP